MAVLTSTHRIERVERERDEWKALHNERVADVHRLVERVRELEAELANDHDDAVHIVSPYDESLTVCGRARNHKITVDATDPRPNSFHGCWTCLGEVDMPRSQAGRFPDPKHPADYLRVLALLPWWFWLGPAAFVVAGLLWGN